MYMGGVRRHLVACVLLSVAQLVMADTGGGSQAAACKACHGSDGNSPLLPPLAEQAPKIAGQFPEYITKQLYDYKFGRRKNDQMSLQARNVPDVDMARIAAYFAAQRIKPNRVADKSLYGRGETLYLRGRGRPNQVTACVGCHWKNGAGQRDWPKSFKIAPALLAPAIGGQHARYVVKQLAAFRDGSRTNDVGRIMYSIAVRLDDEDIAALAEYVSALVY